jgi:hypothetical protein
MIDHAMLLKALKDRDLEIEKLRAQVAIKVNNNWTLDEATK